MQLQGPRASGTAITGHGAAGAVDDDEDDRTGLDEDDDDLRAEEEDKDDAIFALSSASCRISKDIRCA